MKLKRYMFSALSIVLLLLFPGHAIANTDLPITLDSDEWRVIMDTPEFDQMETTRPSENVDMYSLKIENKSEEKENVTLHTFRQDEDKTYDYGMALNDTVSMDAPLENNEFLHFKNFPVHKDTEEFEVLILWQDEADGRFFKQNFTVTLHSS